MKPSIYKISLLTFIILITTLSSCDEQSVQNSSGITKVEVDSTKASLVNVAGKLFSIPSPIQTALLIKKSDAAYQREQLNDPKNSNIYSSRLKRALNLGVFGTDMAYASISDDGQAALRNFKAVENLSENLGIKAAIDADLVKRLGANTGNADSLLLLSGNFYREADNYLKENERTDIAMLVLAGGWVEATYLTAQAAKINNQMAKNRMASQTQAIHTIHEVLSDQSDPELEASNFMQKIDSLKSSFEEVEVVYEYKAPTTETLAKKTMINSTTSFVMADSLFRRITEQIEDLRTEIITP